MKSVGVDEATLFESNTLNGVFPQVPNFASDANIKTENEPEFNENFRRIKSAPLRDTGDEDILGSLTVSNGIIVKVDTKFDAVLSKHNCLFELSPKAYIFINWS